MGRVADLNFNDIMSIKSLFINGIEICSYDYSEVREELNLYDSFERREASITFSKKEWHDFSQLTEENRWQKLIILFGDEIEKRDIELT